MHRRLDRRRDRVPSGPRARQAMTEVSENPLAVGLTMRRVPEPCAVTIFGASGDLTQRKLMPALYCLAFNRFLSDRFGREVVWTLGCAGFIVCFLILLAMRASPTAPLLWAMVLSQGLVGYGMASVFAAIPAELFQGRHYGKIFGTLSLATGLGSAAGPWVAGWLHDRTGDYVLAFQMGIVLCVVSAAAIWLASPRKVRLVAGRVRAAG